jgi:hypothetical protein
MTDLETEMTASLDRNGKGGMLAVLKGIDGVVGGPAYSFTNETTTGIYRAGSNDLRVSIAGTDRAKVNASGLAADTISELTPSRMAGLLRRARLILQVLPLPILGRSPLLI